MPRFAAAYATIIALIGWAALGTDFTRTLTRLLAEGQTPAQAIFGYLRFFTIQTNIATAVAMSLTALRLWRARKPPSAALFRAMLVYLIVTSATYELLLRGLWSPQGVQYVTDLTFHDLVPTLFLAFWLVFAPKRDLPWRSLPWILAYPGAYFLATLVVGAAGGGYPYNFLDAAMLGYAAVLTVALGFLAVFLALGALVTGVARVTAPVPRREGVSVRGYGSYQDG